MTWWKSLHWGWKTYIMYYWYILVINLPLCIMWFSYKPPIEGNYTYIGDWTTAILVVPMIVAAFGVAPWYVFGATMLMFVVPLYSLAFLFHFFLWCVSPTARNKMNNNILEKWKYIKSTIRRKLQWL